MILIGLFGGSPESRESIALTLQRAGGPTGLSVYSQGPTHFDTDRPRVDYLKTVLHGLSASIKAPSLLVTHVMTPAEAELIRARGGRMWHLMGDPSPDIRILPGDLHVTAMVGGCRHYLDALEAYSETALAQGRAR